MIRASGGPDDGSRQAIREVLCLDALTTPVVGDIP